MQMIAGAIVVLAGAVLGAAGIVGYAIGSPYARETAAGSGGAFGAILAILGLVLLLGPDIKKWREVFGTREEKDGP